MVGSQGCLLIVLVQCFQESREGNDVLDCEGNPSQRTIAVPQTTCTLEIRYLTVEIHNLLKCVELTVVHEGRGMSEVAKAGCLESRNGTIERVASGSGQGC